MTIAKGPIAAGRGRGDRRLGVRRIGYEPARMTCEFFESLKSRLPMKASLEPVGGWIEELRMVKSAEELATIRRSRGDELARVRADRGARETRDARSRTWRPSWNTACAVWARRSRASTPSWPAANAPRCRTRNPARAAGERPGGGRYGRDAGRLLQRHDAHAAPRRAAARK